MIGILSFGKRDSLRLLNDTNISQSGQPLCLMAKTTVHSCFFPLGLSCEYVWGVITRRDREKNVIEYRTNTFLPIAQDDIAKFQASGLLPNPLPPISYKTGDVALVCIGWAFVLMAVAGGVMQALGVK